MSNPMASWLVLDNAIAVEDSTASWDFFDPMWSPSKAAFEVAGLTGQKVALQNQMSVPTATSSVAVDPMLTIFSEFYHASLSGNPGDMQLFNARHPGLGGICASLLDAMIAAEKNGGQGKITINSNVDAVTIDVISSPATDGKIATYQELYSAIRSDNPDLLALFSSRNADWWTDLAPSEPSDWIIPAKHRDGDLAMIEEWLAAKATGLTEALDLFALRHPDWNIAILAEHQSFVDKIDPLPKSSPSSPGDWMI